MNWIGFVVLAVIVVLFIEAAIIIPDKLPVIRKKVKEHDKR